MKNIKEWREFLTNSVVDKLNKLGTLPDAKLSECEVDGDTVHFTIEYRSPPFIKSTLMNSENRFYLVMDKLGRTGLVEINDQISNEVYLTIPYKDNYYLCLKRPSACRLIRMDDGFFSAYGEGNDEWYRADHRGFETDYYYLTHPKDHSYHYVEDLPSLIKMVVLYQIECDIPASMLDGVLDFLATEGYIQWKNT